CHSLGRAFGNSRRLRTVRSGHDLHTRVERRSRSVGLARVIGTSEVRARLDRRGCLARVLAVGGVAVLAGCGAANTESGRSARAENAAANAPATTAAPTTTTAPPITYQVKRGDTLT